MLQVRCVPPLHLAETQPQVPGYPGSWIERATLVSGSTSEMPSRAETERRQSLSWRHYSKGPHRVNAGTGSLRTLAEDLLARVAEDWVSAAEVIDLVRRSGVEDPSTLRDIAVGLVGRLIAGDMLVAGDITDRIHVPWSVSRGDAILRIASDWAAVSDPFVMPGSICWLDSTHRGQEVGEAVWRREGNPGDGS